MFKSAGQKNFERCKIKRVSNPPENTFGGRLDCAVTGPDGFETSGGDSKNRLTKLAHDAAKKLCGNCTFAGMTRDEYNAQVTAEADGERARLQAEYELELTRRKIAASLEAATREALQSDAVAGSQTTLPLAAPPPSTPEA